MILLADYLRSNFQDEQRPVTDYALRVVQVNGNVQFLLHPQGKPQPAQYFDVFGCRVVWDHEDSAGPAAKLEAR